MLFATSSISAKIVIVALNRANWHVANVSCEVWIEHLRTVCVYRLLAQLQSIVLMICFVNDEGAWAIIAKMLSHITELWITLLLFVENVFWRDLLHAKAL